jgi:hypothetical protein
MGTVVSAKKGKKKEQSISFLNPAIRWKLKAFLLGFGLTITGLLILTPCYSVEGQGISCYLFFFIHVGQDVPFQGFSPVQPLFTGMSLWIAGPAIMLILFGIACIAYSILPTTYRELYCENCKRKTKQFGKRGKFKEGFKFEFKNSPEQKEGREANFLGYEYTCAKCGTTNFTEKICQGCKTKMGYAEKLCLKCGTKYP